MYHQLAQEERYLISGGLPLGLSARELARKLRRAVSTVSREIKRNATAHDGAYRAEKAHSYAVARRRRTRRGSQFSPKVFAQVDALIFLKWSPEQIVGTLRAEGKVVPSHETIYRRLRRDRLQRGSLFRHTRIMSKIGRKRYRSRPTRGVLLGKRHISERANVVERRGRVGDWEVDTVIGSRSRHCLLTLVERKTGFILVRKLQARTAAEVTREATKVLQRMRPLFRTITSDNGTEFHSYEQLERLFGLLCYFATPYHSWERGSNENANGLLRQYLPKGTCFRDLRQGECNRIASSLNSRPRKRLGYKTPLQVLRRSGYPVALVG